MSNIIDEKFLCHWADLMAEKIIREKAILNFIHALRELLRLELCILEISVK